MVPTPATLRCQDRLSRIISSDAENLADLVLGLVQVTGSCYGYMTSVVTPCPDDRTSQHSPHPLALSASSHDVPRVLVVAELKQTFQLGLIQSHTPSSLTNYVSLCRLLPNAKRTKVESSAGLSVHGAPRKR